MGAILGFGVIAALIVALSRTTTMEKGRTVERALPEAKPPPQDLEYVRNVIVAIKKGTQTEDMVRKAYSIASMYPALEKQAGWLRDWLETWAEFKKAVPATARTATPKKKKLKGVASPFVGVSNAQWSRFVKALSVKDPTTVSPTFHLGSFMVGMRRLQDLGYVTGVEKVEWRGLDGKGTPRKVWRGKWKAPLTLAKFLGDISVQYKVFKESTIDHQRDVLKSYKKYLKKKVKLPDGSEAIITLSGLLALAKAAGITGMGRWLTQPTDRAKFPNTTRLFMKANGLF